MAYDSNSQILTVAVNCPPMSGDVQYHLVLNFTTLCKPGLRKAQCQEVPMSSIHVTGNLRLIEFFSCKILAALNPIESLRSHQFDSE